MPDWLPIVIVALIAASGGWLTYLTSRRSSDSNRLDTLNTRVDKLEKRGVKLINYAQKLRQHIEDGNPPPPPDWPNDIFD